MKKITKICLGSLAIGLVIACAAPALKVGGTQAATPYEIENGNFESGYLNGWTAVSVFKGETLMQAFTTEGVVKAVDPFTYMYDMNSNVVSGSHLRVEYNATGEYLYGLPYYNGTARETWAEKQGVLRSTRFTLGGAGYITFKLGGGENPDLCYLSVKDADSGEELRRYGNLSFNLATPYLPNSALKNPLFHSCDLVEYQADLSQFIGKDLYLEFCDYGSGYWDFLTFDDIKTYHETAPTGGVDAVDIQPVLDETHTGENTLYNGDFSLGMDGWKQEGSAFIAFNGVLASINFGGNLNDVNRCSGAKSVIRSAVFTLRNGGVSFAMAYGNADKWDKNLYISVREAVTNKEIARYANSNANGGNFVYYYADLSEHIGKELYFKIVDNGTANGSILYVSSFQTNLTGAPTGYVKAVNIAY